MSAATSRRLSGLLLAVTVAASLAGCDRPAPAPAVPGAVGPHRGLVLALPGGAGFAEVVVEPAGRGPSRRGPDEVAAYFLGADLKSPLAPPPTAVSLELVLAEAQTRKPVPLAARPRAGDPAGAARFAAAAPDGFDGNLGGRLTVTLDGHDVAISF
jgi:hypothetical protein